MPLGMNSLLGSWAYSYDNTTFLGALRQGGFSELGPAIYVSSIKLGGKNMGDPRETVNQAMLV